MSVSLGDAKMPSLKDKIREESEKVLLETVPELEKELKPKKLSDKVGGKGKKLNK